MVGSTFQHRSDDFRSQNVTSKVCIFYSGPAISELAVPFSIPPSNGFDSGYSLTLPNPSQLMTVRQFCSTSACTVIRILIWSGIHDPGFDDLFKHFLIQRFMREQIVCDCTDGRPMVVLRKGLVQVDRNFLQLSDSVLDIADTR